MAARRRFRAAARANLVELGVALSPELAEELRRLVELPPDEPSQDELRVLQAQLVGWLDGLIAAMRFLAVTPDWHAPTSTGGGWTPGAGAPREETQTR